MGIDTFAPFAGETASRGQSNLEATRRNLIKCLPSGLLRLPPLSSCKVALPTDASANKYEKLHKPWGYQLAQYASWMTGQLWNPDVSEQHGHTYTRTIQQK